MEGTSVRPSWPEAYGLAQCVILHRGFHQAKAPSYADAHRASVPERSVCSTKYLLLWLPATPPLCRCAMTNHSKELRQQCRRLVKWYSALREDCDVLRQTCDTLREETAALCKRADEAKHAWSRKPAARTGSRK